MKIILFVLAVLVGVCLIALGKFGAFYPVTVAEQQIGPLTLVYDVHTGDYAKIKPVMDNVYSSLRDKEKIQASRGFGIYYDNPSNVAKEKLRSIGGCILEIQDTASIKALKEKGYKVAMYPETKAVVADFPMNGPISIVLGIFIVYPKLMQYQAEHKIPQRPIMEMYDAPAKKIRYILGYGIAQEFYERYLTLSQAPAWELSWSDEFEYTGLPDSSKWGYEEGFVRNQEAQYYTRARTENTRVENGVLVIEARKEPYANAAYDPKSKQWNQEQKKATYTSGSITTQGKASWKYGKIEVRAKLPTGRGTWPAIWTLGTNIGEAGWPACGELDIMENVGFDPEVHHVNIHTEKYNHVKKTNKGAQVPIEKPWADFHVYAIEWFPDKIDFFLDGAKCFTFENEGTGNAAWPYDKDQYLILNLAIGGAWGGQKGIDNKLFPQRFLVDFVRVYKQK